MNSSSFTHVSASVISISPFVYLAASAQTLSSFVSTLAASAAWVQFEAVLPQLLWTLHFQLEVFHSQPP